jgi:exodeoxyribonuclease V beta subunit
MKQFNLESDPIEGMNVLEASAGTGKTFTIAGLYLRLVLEKATDVNKILVVTFTEAATAELNQRIRDTLKTALRAFTRKLSGEEQPGITDYPSPIPLLVQTLDAAGAIKRLTVNLQTFDEASIFTIHGFCRMLLLENSFECGTQFDCELETNQDALIESVVSDYWRRTVGHASPLLIRAMNEAKEEMNVGALTRLVRQAMDHLDVEVIPEPPEVDADGAARDYAALIERARHMWEQEGGKIEALLAGNAQLKQTSYAPEKIRVKASSVALFLSMPAGSALFPDSLDVFTQAKVNETVKKNCTPPTHGFFALMDECKGASMELADVYKAAVLGVKRRAFDYAAKHLERRKRELNILAFNDLLLKTRDALRSPSARMLMEKMRSRFSAVLIDEFQDTDPVQHEIFSRLFADGGTILFYIGDPKQAIYGFRGADVFAYMTATAQKDVKKATLAMNYRSTKGLINAVNLIFSRAVDPFVIREIEFSSVNYPEAKPDCRLMVDGREAVPMVLMYKSYARPEGSRKGLSLNKDQSAACVIDAAADEIARLLTLGAQGKAYIEKGGVCEWLNENSIAVLVRTNKQARQMQEALRDAGVYSIVHSKQSIFSSQEADDVLRVMEAAEEPGSASRVRSALITTILGVTSEELDSLNRDGAAMGARHEKFMSLNAEWKKSGFIEMFTRLMEEEEILSRVLALEDGERRAANVLQLAELLQKAESEERLSPGALVKWLANKIATDEQEAEEYVENLSTDERAVNIVTVHGSKGLQYKIVFCPFLWEVPQPRPGATDPPVFFHETTTREGGKHQLVFDIGSAEKESHKRIASEEDLAERARLAYVAVTRAEYQCYILYGNFSSAEESAAVYLLHGDAYGGQGIEAFLADEKAVFAQLDRLSKDSGGTISALRMPDPARNRFTRPGAGAHAHDELLPLPRTRTVIDTSGMISSFTSLSVHEARPAAQTYVDEVQDPETIADPAASGDAVSFARGRLAGDFFHEVLEKVEFDLSNAAELVGAKMRKYNLDAADEAAAIGVVRNVLTKTLGVVGEDFSLSTLERAQRRQEVEFYFPVSTFTRRRLRHFLNAYMHRDGEGTGREEASDAAVKGWLTGKIDMIFMHRNTFYLVDWKSNFLGPLRDDYAPERLRGAMVRSDYFLQSLIYTVAADRYLRGRLPDYSYERNFGGVFYLFLRGIDAASADDCGIFFEKPDAASIAGLSELIAEPMPQDARGARAASGEKGGGR